MTFCIIFTLQMHFFIVTSQFVKKYICISKISTVAYSCIRIIHQRTKMPCIYFYTDNEYLNNVLGTSFFINEHVSFNRSYFTQHVIQYQRRLTSMINQASTTRCTRIYVNNSLSWKNILYMELQINNPSFVFLTFVSTSVHVLEIHYVTIQISPVLYMFLTNGCIE